ncbi:MAG: hypothetical protein M3065_04360 [Actinomycetota bacterium]|nr:hypothetical protein [Actinomycetota bacterium]
MASVRHEVEAEAAAEQVWNAVRDVAAVRVWYLASLTAPASRAISGS